MANINEDMANEDLNSVKFLLGSTLPREMMEKVQVKFCFHWGFLTLKMSNMHSLQQSFELPQREQLPPLSFDRVSWM